MGSIKNTSILDFNYGISDISESHKGAADASLPEFKHIKPTAMPVENRLRKIFKDRSFHAQMLNALEPQDTPSEYLIPYLFRDELKKAYQELTDKKGGSGQGGQGDDEEDEEDERQQQKPGPIDYKKQKRYKKAGKLLKDTEEAWLLLDMYQRSLLRG